MRNCIAAFLLILALTACSKPAPQASDPPPPPAQAADASVPITGGPPAPAGPPAQATADAPGGGLPPAHGMVMTTTIVITNSGSTNTIGYRILIGTNGETSYVSGAGSGKATLPAALYAKLKGDVDAAKPLSGRPRAVSCMKPASFGTSTYLALGGDHTEDLSCPGNASEQTLKADVDAVVAFLKVDNTPRSQGKELPPQNF